MVDLVFLHEDADIVKFERIYEWMFGMYKKQPENEDVWIVTIEKHMKSLFQFLKCIVI